jgi:hypothetical protein
VKIDLHEWSAFLANRLECTPGPPNSMKWRFLLSVASVVLAWFLWRVGLWEQLSMIQQHHHGKHYHVPPAQAVSYTINSPALVLSNFVDNLVVRDLNWPERWFHYGTIEYYIFVFALGGV